MSKLSQPLAYFIEESEQLRLIPPEYFIELACDPEQHIRIQACAGSGKTWLLASRILRLLLNETAPNKILALTFTKKAAFEMQERVLTWLANWQKLDDQELTQELLIRGVDAQAINDVLLKKAKKLYSKLIAQPEYLNISTFDVWFKNLLTQTPVFLFNTTPDRLLTTSSEYFEHLLDSIIDESIGQKIDQDFYNTHKEKDHLLATQLQRLDFEYQIGREKIKSIFTPLFQKRDSQIQYLQNIKKKLKQNLNSDHDLDLDLDHHLLNSLKSEMMGAIRPHISTAKYQSVYQKLELANNAFETYQAITVQKKDDILKLDKAIGFYNHAQIFKQHFLQKKSKNLQYTLALLMDAYCQQKQADQFYDFGDILYQLLDLTKPHHEDEPLFFKMLPQSSIYQHILLDEFQDTNPSQWAFIQQYLKYISKQHTDFKLFIVGDDKQAIYRFRGGDVRVMKAPKHLEIQGVNLNWQSLSTQNTRRCSQQVIQSMNQVLAAENTHGLYPIFIEHTSQHPDLGQAYTLKLSDDATAEMQQLAKHLLHIKQNHALEWRDILIVSRSRSKWPILEQALNQVDIPFFAHRKGGLLQAPVICDLLALVRICLPNPDRYYLNIIENSPLKNFISDAENLIGLQKSSQLSSAACFLTELLTFSHFYEYYPHPTDQFYIQQLLELSLEYTENAGGFYAIHDFLKDIQAHIYSRFSSETPSALAPSFNTVEINTIHGVKGLEAKLVILIDANSPFAFKAEILNDWPIELAYPNASYIGNKDLYQSLCPHVFDEELNQQQQGYFNLLYVAITRAKYGFIATGSQYRKKIAENSWFDILNKVLPCFESATELQKNLNLEGSTVKDQANTSSSTNEKHGDNVTNKDKNQQSSLQKRLIYDFSIPAYLDHPHYLKSNSNIYLNVDVDLGTDAKIDLKNKPIFGTLCHLILQILDAQTNHQICRSDQSDQKTNIENNKYLKRNKIIKSYLQDIRPYFEQSNPPNHHTIDQFYEMACQTVQNLIQMPHLNTIFKPTAPASILCEHEFYDVESRAFFRIDRIIITPEHITIIDYKFGDETQKYLKTYQQQLQNYRKIIESIYPNHSITTYLLLKTGELQEII